MKQMMLDYQGVRDAAHISKLLGIGEKTPKIHEEIEEIFLVAGSIHIFSLFVRHAPEVFPNLRSLHIDKPVLVGELRGAHIDDTDGAPWPALEHFEINATHKDIGVLLEQYEFPKLQTLKCSNVPLACVEAIIAHHSSWPEFRALSVSTHQAPTHQLFSVLRDAGLFSHLDRLELSYRTIGKDREAACATADLVLDESIPEPWRQHLFKAILAPGYKPVLYAILKHVDAPVHSKMNKSELQKVYEEFFPKKLFRFQAEGPFDLTAFEDF